MTIIKIIETIAPDLYSITGINDHIALAKIRTSQEVFRDKYNLAVALRACHTAELSQGSGSAFSKGSGAIKQIREGDQSISFGSVSGVDGDLSRTRFGVMLDDLIKGSVPGISVSGILNLL